MCVCRCVCVRERGGSGGVGWGNEGVGDGGAWAAGWVVWWLNLSIDKRFSVIELKFCPLFVSPCATHSGSKTCKSRRILCTVDQQGGGGGGG